MIRVFIVLILFMTTPFAYGASQTLKQAEEENKGNNNDEQDLTRFGFGPAFYMISYQKEILSDSKDVRILGDGSIDSLGSKYGTAIGLEVHYDISVWGARFGTMNGSEIKWTKSKGLLLSPFLGVYDIENGINGLVFGGMVGYWKGDGDFENRKSLNFGIGRTVHRNQLVLSNRMSEGAAPPIGLTTDDYTSREDVKGTVFMVSISTGF